MLFFALAQGGMPIERAAEPTPLSSNWRVRATKLNHFITTHLIWLGAVSQLVNQWQNDTQWHDLWHCLSFTVVVKMKCVCDCSPARRCVKSGVMPAVGLFSAQRAVESATTLPHQWLEQTLTLLVFYFTATVLERFHLHAIIRKQSKPRCRLKKETDARTSLKLT